MDSLVSVALRTKSNNCVFTSEEILSTWKNGKGGIVFLHEIEMAFKTVFLVYIFAFSPLRKLKPFAETDISNLMINPCILHLFLKKLKLKT